MLNQILFYLLFSNQALASDTWTNIATGIDYLHRVETGSTPQDIFAARIDLSNPLISLHTSANSVGVERGVSTLTFANNSGSIVALNGDWGTLYDPVSINISDGDMWNPHFSNPSVASAWGYFGCDIFNNCDASTAVVSDPFFQTPFLRPHRFFNAIGSNGVMLVNDGVRLTGCYDSTQNPRSAICLDQNRTELWMIAVDGRRSAASGMTCDEMRDLVIDLGCWDAAMQDGGGSTNLVMNGTVKNVPSDGSPRLNVNHIGVILASSVDSQCQVSSGKWCTGESISTCSGGRFLGTGDCAFFGATCEEDGDYAYCVSYQCPNGEGNGVSCTSSTEIEQCNDGWYFEGDCAVFGLECGTDALGSSCMQSECLQGPNSGFCISGATVAQCTDGVYAETSCAEDEVCEVENGNANCVASMEDTGEVNKPSAEPGSEPSAEPSSEPAAEASNESPSEPSDDEVDEVNVKNEGGCQMVQTELWLVSLGLVMIGLRRRRTSNRI